VAGRGRLTFLKLEAGVFIKLTYFTGGLSNYVTKFGVTIYFKFEKGEIFKFTHRCSGRFLVLPYQHHKCKDLIVTKSCLWRKF